MRLEYVGSVGELMRATTTGSFRDSATNGCGTTRRRTDDGGVGSC